MADDVIPFPGSARRKQRAEEPDEHDLVQQLIQDLGGPQAALAHLGALARSLSFPPMFERPTPTLLHSRRIPATYVVRVDLDGAKPPIWRRLRLRNDLNLGLLHDILQVTMGWTDSHLHQFKMGPTSKDYRMAPFATDYDVSTGETEGIRERTVRLDEVLGEPGHRLFYEYDFGDSWEHTIKLEKIEPWVEGQPDAVCVTGRRACPPEDIGGILAYQEAVAYLRGEVSNEDLAENAEWAREVLDWFPADYDPEEFDADEINEMLEQAPVDLAQWHPGLGPLLAKGGGQFSPIAGLVSRAIRQRVELTEAEYDAAAHRYRHLIAVIGTGVKLTQAGYLPVALVRRLATDLELHDIDGPFPVSRETECSTVLALRQSATTLGLLRKQHGRLLPTASAKKLVGDPRALFARIRDRLPAGRDPAEVDAGLLALLFVASGEDFYAQRRVAGDVFASLGWSSTEPMERVVWYYAGPTIDVLCQLAEGRPEIDPARIAGALLTR